MVDMVELDGMIESDKKIEEIKYLKEKMVEKAKQANVLKGLLELDEKNKQMSDYQKEMLQEKIKGLAESVLLYNDMIEARENG